MTARGLFRSRAWPAVGGRVAGDRGLAFAICVPALTAAVLAPEQLRPVALVAAFVAGATVERYRQGRRGRPLRLAETPAAWGDAVRHSIGVAHALAAGLAAAAALGLVLLPSLSRAPSPDRAAAARGHGQAPAVSDLPRIEVVRPGGGRRFSVRGLSFRVFRIRQASAGVGVAQRPAGRGLEWLQLGVDVRNVGRRRFRPNSLAYRVKDERGRAYWPDVGGGTGPATLAKTGFLERGESAQARLGLRVPRSARRLRLVFEPVPNGSLQVEVPLPRESAS
jgi:hypothetical protein